jgi:alpha-beta hydrolase superfamily lysophospholipase
VANHAPVLFERRWQPDSPPKGVVVIVHGYAEHSGRYEHVAAVLRGRGFAVEAFDLRGHGKSPGRRAYVRSADEYLDDVNAALTRARERFPRLPLFLLGHSMGGGMVALLVIRDPQAAHGVVLSAPSIRGRRSVPRIVGTILRVIGRLLPRLRLNKLDSALVSRDPDVVARYDSDPLVYRGGMAAGTLRAMVEAGREVTRDMERFALPVLLVHGAEDGLTDPAGSRELFERASTADKQLKLYPGLYHEVMNEPERAEVLSDIARWLDAQVAASAAVVAAADAAE